MQITLQQSRQIKGFAILLMIFLHLFMNPNFADSCTPLLYVGDIPLATIITRSCGPVGYFLMMSGYGLSIVYSKRLLSPKKQIKKVFSLYKSYWLVMFVFVSIGAFVKPIKYPGDIYDIVSNITGWDTSYNAEMWFLLPYALLAITSLWIFKAMDRLGIFKSFIISVFLYLASCYVISRYIAPNKLYHEFYTPILTYFDLLLSFVIGALFLRIKNPKTDYYFSKHNGITVLCLFLIFCSHFLTSFDGITPFHQAIIVYLFLQITLNKYVSLLLHSLGKHSMFMWMVHTYIALYLFHDFIYGFRYPIIIFLVLVIISYILAIIFEFINGKLINWKR